MSKFLHTSHRDIAWFKQADELSQLQMRPPFQRNLVWTEKQKSFLIDSVLNGYPIPEIYMQDITYANGQKSYIIIDGQQRITACLEYIQIEMRDIFQRLNRNNVVLNTQELRQATYWGHFIKTMNKLAEHPLWTKIDVFTATDIKRMKDVEFISELAIAALHGLQNKKTTIDKYYTLYEEEFEEKEELKNSFDSLLRNIVRLLPEIGNLRWSKKTDFYTLFLLLYKHRDKMPLEGELFESVRSKLMNFAEQTDKFLKVQKEEGNTDEINQDVVEYSLNVRASTDLGARRKREDSLNRYLNDLEIDSN